MPETNLNFDEFIDRKETDCLKFDFAIRRGKPSDVLPLWVADMDFRTSSRILDEIHKRVDHGIFGYTEPREEYYKAVDNWLTSHYNMHIEKNWLVRTPGVVFAIAMAVKAFAKEGEAVLIQQPVYYPFSETVVDNNRKLISNDLVLGSDDKYHIDFEDFERKVRDNNVKLFVLCSPHNPVGRVWMRDELQKIIDICIKYNVVVFSDEIHEDFTFPGYTHIPLINVDERIKSLCITATSPAKTFNLAGLQISNIIISDSHLKARFKKEVAASGYSQPNTIGATACVAAYNYGEEWYEAVKIYINDNLNFLRDYLHENIPEVKLIEPEGTYLIWLDFRGLGLSVKELDDLITNKAKLWLDGGEIFGKIGEGFQRINIATNRCLLKEALDRIKLAISKSYH